LRTGSTLGQDRNGDLSRFRQISNAFDDLKAGGAGHHEVHEDEIGAFANDACNAFLTAERLGNTVSLLLEDLRKGFPLLRVIVDDEHR